MAHVVGIGGVFIKSRDVDALRAWYRDVLGLDLAGWGGAQFGATPDRQLTVWNPFKADTEYFAPSTREVMVNFRVDDLDGLLARLRVHGAQVLDRREDTADGKFGYVLDPDGTLLELWEPARAS